MPFHKLSSMDRSGVEQTAQGWGRIVARRIYEQVGPELDLDADDIEQVATSAARALAKGTVEELLEKRAAVLGAEQPCPTCKRLCPVQREPREIHFWGGPVTYAEPKCHCLACRRDFFPSTPGIAPHIS